MRSHIQALTGALCASAIALMGLSIPAAFAQDDEADSSTPDTMIVVRDVGTADVYEAVKLLNVTVTVGNGDDEADEYAYESVSDDMRRVLWEAIGNDPADYDSISAANKAIYAFFAYAPTNATAEFYETLNQLLADKGIGATATGVVDDDAESKTGKSSFITITLSDDDPYGYYLVRQTAGATPFQYQLVDVHSTTTIMNPKDRDLTFSVKIKDYETSTGNASDWQDAADYSKNSYAVGESDATLFALQEQATLQSNLSDVETFQLVAHTELEDGINVDPNAIRVYVGDPDKGGGADYVRVRY